ncbi:MAG: hypothetical protein C4519_22640 [Desulfobacteraceae bacterium]|nr:MAG: hypothetical protein C4519_22640 [Desulfobacteraceae bacterium]
MLQLSQQTGRNKIPGACPLSLILPWMIAICLSAVLLIGCGPAVEGDSNEVSPAESAQTAGVPTAHIDVKDLVFGSDYRGNYEIYLMTPGGANARQLTDDPAFDNWWPRISPDRRKILFYRAPFGEGGRYQSADLMVMDADGRNIRILRAAGDDDWHLQAHAEWSPDGSELVMCGTGGDIVHLFVTDDNGTVLRQLTFDGTWNCDPSWSPDGRSIVYNRCAGDCGSHMANLDIYTLPSSGGGPPQQLTADSLADYDPYYSPDGAAIAWLRNVRPEVWSGLGAWSIYIMDKNGTNPRRVIDDGQINSKPAWSLGGERIFFHRLAPSLESAPRWRIFSIRPDGSQMMDIDPFESGHSEYPSN